MKKIFLSFIGLLTCVMIFSQGFAVNDSAIVFKDKGGSVLSKEQALLLMKQKFSMTTVVLPDGKKSLTIVPLTNEAIETSREIKQKFVDKFLNKELKQFSLRDVNGDSVSSVKLKGRITVLNFWFTSCKPCIMEIPQLNKLVANYKGKSVVFLGLTFESAEGVKAFLKKRKFNYQQLAAAKSFIDELEVISYPTHIIVDEVGIIRKVVIGFGFNIGNEIQETIDELLNKGNLKNVF